MRRLGDAAHGTPVASSGEAGGKRLAVDIGDGGDDAVDRLDL
jgi:hypothetical protein